MAKLIEMEGATHGIYDGISLNLFRDKSDSYRTMTHVFYLTGKDLLKIMEEIDIDDLRDRLNKHDDIPF
jgi:hypothetical protein